MTSIDRADMKGRRVEVPAKITRVASISPYVTLTALALGGEDVLVGVDSGSCQNANLAVTTQAVSLRGAPFATKQSRIRSVEIASLRSQ